MAGLNTAQILDRARNKGISLSDAQAQQILSQAWDQAQYGADPGKVDSLLGSYGGGSNGGGGGGTAQDFMNSIKDELTKQMDEFNKKVKTYDATNPFTFDEAQAKASAAERYNPYYNAELHDFMSGIDAQRSTLNGEKSLLVDLNKIQTQQDQTKLNDAIAKSQEGFAGAGLFFSGARARDTGQLNVAGNQTSQARQDTFNQNMLSNTNQLGQLDTSQQRGVRQFGAQQTTDIENEIARQKAEARNTYDYNRLQYLGYPYISSTGVQGGLQSLLSGFNKY